MLFSSHTNYIFDDSEPSFEKTRVEQHLDLYLPLDNGENIIFEFFVCLYLDVCYIFLETMEKLGVVKES